MIVLVLARPLSATGRSCGTRSLTPEEQSRVEKSLAPGRDRVAAIDHGPGVGPRDELAGVTHTINEVWFFMRIQSKEEREAKTALRHGGPETLNISTVDGSPYLGWATFPSSDSSQPDLDGVVINFRSMPGVSIESFNLGFTATHETGHWLALYHTFQNGCSTNNDYIVDTPAERYPASGCPIGLDTCTRYPGLDPVENYMDYSDDPCYTEFTTGQTDRMQAAWFTYRQ